MRFLTIMILLLFILLFAFFTQSDSTGQPCGERYIIQQGESLADIAARCGVTLEQLLAWNPQIEGPEDVQAGDILTLPPADADATLIVMELNTAAQTPAPTQLVIVPGDTSPPVLVPVTGGEAGLDPAPQIEVAPQPVPQPQPSGGGTTTYTVQQCDTLFAIATSYGTSVAAIQTVNPNITNPDLILVGQQITIPLP